MLMRSTDCSYAAAPRGRTTRRKEGEHRPALRHRRPPFPFKHRLRKPRVAPSDYRTADRVGRDYELQDVLDGLAASLKAIGHITTPEHDERLSVIEAEIGPYALAFAYEINRLDGLVTGSQDEGGSACEGAG